MKQAATGLPLCSALGGTEHKLLGFVSPGFSDGVQCADDPVRLDVEP